MGNKVEIHIDYHFLFELTKFIKVDLDLFSDVVRSLKKANLIIYSTKNLRKQDLANNPSFALIRQLIDGSKLVIDNLESIEASILDVDKLHQYYFLEELSLKNKPSNFGKIQIKASELKRNIFLFKTILQVANLIDFNIKNYLTNLKHNHNSIIICDPYFFEKFDLSMNVISCLINSNIKEYDLSIFATDVVNVDLFQEKIKRDFKNLNVAIYDCNENDLHDRFIITNYMYFSFSNSIYTYNNLKKQSETTSIGLLSENQKVLFERINYLKNLYNNNYYGDGNNRLMEI